MPIYQYKAFAPGGSVQTGVVDADTERDARQKLRKEKLLVSDLAEMRGGRRSRKKKPGEKQSVLSKLSEARARQAGVGAREAEIIGGITRQLATLLGLSLIHI